MTHEALTAIEPKMLKAIEAMERDFATIRTGRASTGMVERITVDYYGTQTPLNQVAGISTPDPHLIVIQPWDRSVLVGDREGDHEERHRPRAERRWHRRQAQRAATDRGAEAGDGEAGPPADRGGPRRGPQPSS